MPFKQLFAERTENMRQSAIREILKVVSRPGMISLAGGIPAPETFPDEIIRRLAISAIDIYSHSAFQYDLTEGFLPLREALSGYLKGKGLHLSSSEIIITSGSQGALDAIGKVLITKGDRVAVEAPTYLGALQAFNPYEPVYRSIETDDDGIIPDSLEALLKREPIKFIYLVPTFQNPTGRTITLERRKAVAEIIKKYNVILVEDDPYADLRYSGEALPPIKTFAPDHTVYLGTLSKVFAPGFRIGFACAPQEIREWLVIAKQGVDLHTGTFSQAVAAQYLLEGHLEKHLPTIVGLYKPRLEAMLAALERYFPDDFKWSRPEGGMFIWAEGPNGLDMEALYHKAVLRNVAFVPGKYFYAEKGQGDETMRLNFTMATIENIEKSIKTLAEVIKANR